MPRPKVSKVEKVSPSYARASEGKKVSPQTMEELLAQSDSEVKGLKRGQQIEGIVTNISSKVVYVDIGAKTEGIVAAREFEAAKDYIKNLKVGDKVLLSVVIPEDQAGQALLSLKKAAFGLAWKKFFEAKNKEEEVEIQVKEATPAGLLVTAFVLSGFIPTSQIGKIYQGKTKELVGKKLMVKVLEIDESQNRLVFSEKAVSEKEKMAKTKKFLEKIEIGKVFEGEVTGFKSSGILVQIKVEETEIEGLVYLSEISWERIEEAEKLFPLGIKVKVKVIGKDEEKGRLSFSIKQLTLDPWQERSEKYPADTRIKGKVLRLAAYGAIIEVEEGLEGLLHISKIPPQMKIDVGDTLDCFVEKIEPEKRRISLGLVLKEKPVGYK